MLIGPRQEGRISTISQTHLAVTSFLFSLISVFQKKFSKIYHLDSISNYHTQKSKDIVFLLHKLGFIYDDYELWQSDKCFKQDFGWECGFYTILSAFIFIFKWKERLSIWKENSYTERMTIIKEMFRFFGDHEIEYLKPKKNNYFYK